MTSVLRSEDIAEMPESVKQEIPVELPADALAHYKKMQKDMVFTNEDYELVVDNAGAKYNKLRQIAQGAMYVGTDATTNRSIITIHEEKAMVLKELVEAANGDPVLCAIYFKFEAETIRRAFGSECDVPLIAGGVQLGTKVDILKRWDEGLLPLLLCHPASMSHGLNMQTGGHIICWYSLPWSLEHYKQLNGRLVRPGQKRSVQIYHLMAKRTIDYYVSNALMDKDVTNETFKRALLEAERGEGE
jgi:hypothetical protein